MRFPNGFRILKTFDPPVPTSKNFSLPEFDREFVYFPKAGEYYLYTNAGYLKVLIIKNSQTDRNCLNIFQFVSRNCIHSTADYRFRVPNRYPVMPFRIRFFCTAEPMKVNCRGASNILLSIMREIGYKARAVDIYKSDEVGHDITEAFFPELKKWVMLDPDFGCYCDKDGVPLSIQEIAYFLREGIKIDVVDPVGKKALKPIYNLTPYQPPFSFRKDMLSNHRMVVKKRYLNLLSQYTRKIVIMGRKTRKVIYKDKIPRPAYFK